MHKEKQKPLRQAPYLLPTLLDRLIDDEPHEKWELPQNYAVNQSRMREILQRDLSWLLNTTNLGSEVDRAETPELASSVLNYGVPPFSGKYILDRNWGRVEQIIRQVLLDFEPRLLPDTVSVTPLAEKDSDANYNVLSFQISGLVYMQPYPMEFLVQSSLDLETNRLSFS